MLYLKLIDELVRQVEGFDNKSSEFPILYQKLFNIGLCEIKNDELLKKEIKEFYELNLYDNNGNFDVKKYLGYAITISIINILSMNILSKRSNESKETKNTNEDIVIDSIIIDMYRDDKIFNFDKETFDVFVNHFNIGPMVDKN